MTARRPMPLAVRRTTEAVAAMYGLKVGDLLRRDQRWRIVRPRWVAIAAIRAVFPHNSTLVIGEWFGQDHSTILHGLRRLEELLPDDPWLAETYLDALAVAAAELASQRVRMAPTLAAIHAAGSLSAPAPGCGR